MPTKPRRWALALGGLAVAVFLGVVATPRLFAQMMIVSQSDAAQQIVDGAKTSRANIESAQQAYDRAIGWQPNNTTLLTMRGRLAMRMSELPEVNPAERTDLYKSAAGYFRGAVAAGPDYQYGWCLLAFAEQKSGTAPEQVAKILEFAYLLGPYESSCMALRGSAGLAVWPSLSSSTQDAVRLDLKNLWATPPLRSYLVDIYIAVDPSSKVIIRKAALTTPQEARFFDRRVMKVLGFELPKKK